MTDRFGVARGVALFLSTMIVLGALGCSDDGIGKRYKVSGTVTYKGVPVEKGTINFVPLDPDGRGAGGQIENGEYTLTTLKPNDGALAGEYKVTVDTRSVDQEAMKAKAEEIARQKGMKGELSMIPQDIQAAALAQSKSTVPGKYQIPETSDIVKTVEAKSNTIDIELKD